MEKEAEKAGLQENQRKGKRERVGNGLRRAGPSRSAPQPSGGRRPEGESEGWELWASLARHRARRALQILVGGCPPEAKGALKETER